MCQLHLSLSNTPINYSKDAAEDLYMSNSDGLGFIDFANPGQAVKIVPDTFKQAWDFIQTHINGRCGVVHWRMRTSGATDVERVHPYVINDGFYLLHNGIMRAWESPSTSIKEEGKPARYVAVNDKSDTQNLAEHLALLAERNPDLLRDPHFHSMLGRMIGDSNRLVIVDRISGESWIVNEDTGFYPDAGIWQANMYAGDYIYTPPKFTAVKGGKKKKSKSKVYTEDYDRYIHGNWMQQDVIGYEGAWASPEAVNADADAYPEAANSDTEEESPEVFTMEHVMKVNNLHHPVQTLEHVVAWYKYVFSTEDIPELEAALAKLARVEPATFMAALDSLDDAIGAYVYAENHGHEDDAIDSYEEIEHCLENIEDLAFDQVTREIKQPKPALVTEKSNQLAESLRKMPWPVNSPTQVAQWMDFALVKDCSIEELASLLADDPDSYASMAATVSATIKAYADAVTKGGGSWVNEYRDLRDALCIMKEACNLVRP